MIRKIIAKIIRRIFSNKQTVNSIKDYWGEQRYLEKTEFKYVLWLYEIYKKIERVPGHIVELGVAYGRNTIIFSHLMHMHNEQDIRQYIGFDTFDGFTEESLKVDTHLSDNSWKDISIDNVKERIRKAGDFKNYSLIQGDLIQTTAEYVKQNPNLRISLLYVDCNAYLPALAGMRILKDYMTPGGIICIDEKKQGGETRALIEFCKENNLKFIKDASPFSMPAYTVVD